MKLFFASLTIATLVSAALADVQLRRDTVVKVTFDSSISLRHNREGDTFTATVTDGPDLPIGSKFLGRVAEIHPPDDRHPGYMNLRFDAVRLGSGETFAVHAVPVKLNYVREDGSGRLRVDQPKVRKENFVLGGLLGGLLGGALLHKPFEGAFVGVLAGIVVGESSATDSSEGYVVRRGDAIGALIQEDVRSGDGSYNPDYQAQTRNDDPFGRPAKDQSGGYQPRPNSDDPFAKQPANRDGDPYSRPRTTGNIDPFAANHRRDPRSAADVSLAVGDQTLSFAKDQAPYWSDSIKSVASQLKIETDEVSDGHVLYLSNEDFTARIEQGQSSVRVNGRHSSIDRSIEGRGGVLYGPISLFSQLHIGTVRINGTKLDK